jgi:alanine-glyoxylate transaminase/serine-glyoxylate transaminase/serine-pyruvate transaminase
MTRPTKLFIPGPCDIDDDVLEVMGQPVRRSHGPEWLEDLNETTALLKGVFRTAADIFIVPGPGSAALDMALGSLAAAGDKAIVAHNGFFGDRLAFIAECGGIEVVRVAAPAGRPLDPADLAKALAVHPDARVVALVHHETTTTVLNPLRDMAALVREAGRILVVDAVSSLGGEDLPVDEWRVDVCVTASNKCLEAPPGLSLISVGPRAWDQIKARPRTNHGWYLDLKTWRWYAENWGSWHPAPVTMPTNLILALQTSLRKIAAVGLDAHIAKHRRACRAVRTGLRDFGFEMFVPDDFAAAVATGVLPRSGFSAGDLIQWLAAERGIYVGGGIGEMSGKIFRVGHLGKAVTKEYLLEFFSAVEEFLKGKGIAVREGAAASLLW